MNINITSDEELAQDYNANALPAKTDLQNYSLYNLTITGSVTTGDNLPIWGKQVQFHFGFSDTDMDAEDAKNTISSQFISVTPAQEEDGEVSTTSDPVLVTGRYLYTWVKVVDPLGQSVTINIAADGISLGGGNSIIIYTTNPNDENLEPADPTQPCLAYKDNGTGSTFSWSIVEQMWK